jgi:hypothetical protein
MVSSRGEPAIDASQCATETGGRTFPARQIGHDTDEFRRVSFSPIGGSHRAQPGGDRRADQVPFSPFRRKSESTVARFTFLNVRPLLTGTFLIRQIGGFTPVAHL